MDLTTPPGMLPRVAAAMLMTAQAPTVKKAAPKEHFQAKPARTEAGSRGLKAHFWRSRVGQIGRSGVITGINMTISAGIRCWLAALFALGLGGLVAWAQDYPNRPVTIVVP